MTDPEIQILRQEKIIAELRAELWKAKKQISDLTNIHKADQKHIGTLQAQLARQPQSLAEQVFNGQEKT